MTARETLAIRSSEDVVIARQKVRTISTKLGFSVVMQTKLITAASELARNTLDYGGGGEVHIEEVSKGIRPGLKLTFMDKGPGISDLTLAMTDGYTTGKGLGLGLSGAKRLCDEFEIQSVVGEGTTISITQWK